MEKMKILSIDARAGYEPETWEWNNWFKVGEISKEEFESLKTNNQIAEWMHENGYTTTSNIEKIHFEDDGYNIVLCDKEDLQPIFAIEYGPFY